MTRGAGFFPRSRRISEKRTVLPCCGLPLSSRVTRYTSTSLPPSCACSTPFSSVVASDSVGFARVCGLVGLRWRAEDACSCPGSALAMLDAAVSTAFRMLAILRLNCYKTGELEAFCERERERLRVIFNPFPDSIVSIASANGGSLGLGHPHRSRRRVDRIAYSR